MKMNCRSKCKSKIYDVSIIVTGDVDNVRNFLRDNKFINDLYCIKSYYINSPVAQSRARASRACGGMDTSVQKPITFARSEE